MAMPNLESYNVNLPPNFIIKAFVPQQEILKKASLFITFGGYNSICEAIEYEVPMLVKPVMNDQFLNAYLLEKLKVAIDVSK